MMAAQGAGKPTQAQGQWVPIFLAGGAIVLLLLVANVQLWRVAEDEEAASPARLPSLPQATERQGGPLLKDLDRTLGELETQFEMTSEVALPIDALSGQLSGLASQSEELVPALTTLTGFQGQLDRISRVTPQIASIPDQLRQLDSGIEGTDELGDRLAALNRQIKQARAVRGDVRTLNSRASGLLDTAGVLDGKATGLLDTAGGLETTVSGLSSQFDGLNDRLDELDTNVSGLGGTLTGFQEAIEVTNGQLEILVDFICGLGAEAPEACDAEAASAGTG